MEITKGLGMKNLFRLLLLAVVLLPNLVKAAYDPTTGVWLSRDPLPSAEIKLGPNLYQYVKNNPVKFIDPLGLQTVVTGDTPIETAELADVAAQMVDGGSSLSMEEAIVNSAGNLTDAESAAVNAAKNMTGSPQQKADYIKSIMEQVAKKLGRSFKCSQQNVGNGRLLIGGPGPSGTPAILITPGGNVLQGMAGDFGIVP